MQVRWEALAGGMQEGAPELEELRHHGAGRGAGRGGAAGDARRQGAMALGGSAGVGGLTR